MQLCVLDSNVVGIVSPGVSGKGVDCRVFVQPCSFLVAVVFCIDCYFVRPNC